MPRVAIALGSNLGDRAAHLRWAIEQIQPLLTNIRISTFVETEPVDVPGLQPPYLNAVVTGETSRPAQSLLDLLLDIERRRGRRRPAPRAPRTLDLDLILYGDATLDLPGLTVPHPAFRDRLFVLEPLAEIDPELIDPVTGQSIRRLLETRRARDAGAD